MGCWWTRWPILLGVRLLHRPNDTDCFNQEEEDLAHFDIVFFWPWKQIHFESLVLIDTFQF